MKRFYITNVSEFEALPVKVKDQIKERYPITFEVMASILEQTPVYFTRKCGRYDLIAKRPNRFEVKYRQFMFWYETVINNVVIKTEKVGYKAIESNYKDDKINLRLCSKHLLGQIHKVIPGMDDAINREICNAIVIAVASSTPDMQVKFVPDGSKLSKDVEIALGALMFL
jgi:hypothetical protein